MPPLQPDIRLQTVATDQLARCLCCRTGGRRGVRVDKELRAACADSDELTEPITYAMRYRTLEQRAGGTRRTVQLHGHAPVGHHSLTVICAGVLHDDGDYDAIADVCNELRIRNVNDTP
jgi:hypothetical protein